MDFNVTHEIHYEIDQDGQQVRLGVEDLCSLLARIAADGGICIFDRQSSRLYGSEDIFVSVNGNSVQLTIKNEGEEDTGGDERVNWNGEGF